MRYSSSVTKNVRAGRRGLSILEMSAAKARTFLLKEESYCTIDLPPYIRLGPLLDKICAVLEGKQLSELQSAAPRDLEGVNHLILNNKDGRHAWRPLQLVNPVLYVSLVNRITEEGNWKVIRERFVSFAENERIRCLSLPVESLTEEEDKAAQIAQWWHQVEQASIELALDYEFIIHTDIVDCYGDIYTHSISWALHTKATAKEKRSEKSLIGNVIDWHIQDMRYGQTNGIPQGAVLMDFIAEMVLGYADFELTKKIAAQGIADYQILRYRDDYRIFVNNSQDGDRILKCLTEVMVDLGLKLSREKTKFSNQVVSSALKDDKLSWLSHRQADENLQKFLLIIHSHSINYPNSGSLIGALDSFFQRISSLEEHDNPLPLISIVVDIAYKNPRTYAICAAILSKLITFLGTTAEKLAVIDRTKRKFSQIPNTGHMEIWLQRISLPFAPDMDFNEPLCQLVRGGDVRIWNVSWISSHELKRAFDNTNIIDTAKLCKLEAVVPKAEVALFVGTSEYCL